MRALVLPHQPADWTRWTARALSTVWAGFWTFFCAGSAIADGQPLLGFLRYVTPAVVFCAAVALAWRRERAGGVALLAAAAGSIVLFDLPHRAFAVWLAMVAPPVLAGALFLMTERRRPG